MDSYNIFFKRSAEKELRKISQPFLSQILHKIGQLSINPRPQSTQLLKGEGRYFRLRNGDYRILYEVNDAEKTVTVIKVGHRREVYD